jgi:putative transcriptional regulator
LRKHGVAFEDATDVFYDDGAVIEDDPDSDEERFTIIGMSRRGLLLVVYTNAARTRSGSYRPGRPRNMKSERTVTVERRGGRFYEVLPDGTTRPHKAAKSDWARLAAMTDEEVLAAAKSDPDNPPLTPTQLSRMRRISPAKHLRWKLGLSQAEFARRFRIPLGTLRDWEQHRSEPDQAARAYLKVIAADAGFVERALAS